MKTDSKKKEIFENILPLQEILWRLLFVFVIIGDIFPLSITQNQSSQFLTRPKKTDILDNYWNRLKRLNFLTRFLTQNIVAAKYFLSITNQNSIVITFFECFQELPISLHFEPFF